MLSNDRGPDGLDWGVHRARVEHGCHPTVHLPGVTETSLGMVMKQERENFSLPDHLALEFLYDGLSRE